MKSKKEPPVEKMEESLVKGINEIEASNLPDTEFNKMVIRMLKESVTNKRN